MSSRSASGERPSLPGSTHGWLRRSGNLWKVDTGELVMAVPAALVAGSFVASPLFRSSEPAGRWGFLVLVAAVLASVAFSLFTLVVRTSVRCRVCGLRLASCNAARPLRERKWAWISTLDACPVCGDDGRATAASRAQWIRAGKPAEEPYWSTRRVGVAVFLTGLAVACFWLAAVWAEVSVQRNPPPIQQQRRTLQ